MFLMPVCSLVRVSRSASISAPWSITLRRRSTSSLYPGRMNLPSRTEKGGSSTRAELSSARSWGRSSISRRRDWIRAEGQPSSSSRSRGSLPSPADRAARSRPPAVPYTTLPIRRSRSVISFRQSTTSSRVMMSSTRSLTACCRRLICTGERRGRSIHPRISRRPMAVRVLSSTHSREPFFSLPRRVSVSSRVCRAFRSSSMNWPAV